jgi:hypothetical protein
MKRILGGSLALAVLGALVVVATTSKRIVRPVYAHNGCSLASLSGNYAFSQQGFEPRNARGTLLPFDDAGVITLDGGGNFSFTITDMSPGKPDPYLPIQLSGAGTYTVNSDCTGSGSVTSGDAAGITLNLAIIDGGREVFGIQTTPFIVATSDWKKQ